MHTSLIFAFTQDDEQKSTNAVADIKRKLEMGQMVAGLLTPGTMAQMQMELSLMSSMDTMRENALQVRVGCDYCSALLCSDVLLVCRCCSRCSYRSIGWSGVYEERCLHGNWYVYRWGIC